MTKRLKWRLSRLPTPDELRELVKDKIITQEEAREILFSSEEEGERDEKSLKDEIKFLRDLVEKLSTKSSIITTIREIEVPYRRHGWYRPYDTWCDGTTYVNSLSSLNNSSDTMALASLTTTASTNSAFSDINNF